MSHITVKPSMVLHCGSSMASYQMVYRDEFQNDGVLILANLDSSTLIISPHGILFLFEQLQSDVLVVSCIAVVDDVNLNVGPPVLVYADGQCSL